MFVPHLVYLNSTDTNDLKWDTADSVLLHKILILPGSLKLLMYIYEPITHAESSR